MKKFIIVCLMLMSTMGFSQPVEWLTSLEAAQRLSLIQNKMIVMTWEDSMTLPLPVTIKDENGVRRYIDDLFKNGILINLLKEHFILVSVNESEYPKMIEKIENKRSKAYIDKFNDDSLKVMDANGTIVNVDAPYQEFFDIATFIQNYAINTEFINAELKSYYEVQNFVTTFRLSSRYLDMASYVFSQSREEFVNVSSIYLKEAEKFLIEEAMDNQEAFQQKIELKQLEQELVLGNPKKVLRKLKRLDPTEINDINNTLVSFLYFTSYLMRKDETNASNYRSDISLIDLKRASAIINSYVKL